MGLHYLQRALLIAVAVLQATGCGRETSRRNDGGPPQGPEVEWVKKQAIRLTTVEAEHGLEDLEALRSIVGEARVVALGESTHGSREQFQLKHRIIEYLVSEMGFNTFSIEASMPESYRVDEFVSGGEGDPVELIDGMHFWTWSTEEVLAMVEWMRAVNAKALEHSSIRFTGFDMQTPEVAAQIVVDNVARVDAEPAASLRQRYDALQSAEPAEAHREALQILAELAEQRTPLASKLNDAEAAWTLQMARVVGQSMECRLADRAGGSTVGDRAIAIAVRDRAMADNVQWILAQDPSAKIILWAHNGHVATAPSQMMGGHLKKALGDDYLAFGFATSRGEYRAMSDDGSGLGSHPLLPAPADSTESFFEAAELDVALLDLRGATEDSPEAGWLTDVRWMRSIGAGEMGYQFFQMKAYPTFDVLAYTAATTPARPLRATWDAVSSRND